MVGKINPSGDSSWGILPTTGAPGSPPSSATTASTQASQAATESQRQTLAAKSVPPPPLASPLLDASGKPSAPWAFWYTQVWRRSGGDVAPSSDDLQITAAYPDADSLGATRVLSALQDLQVQESYPVAVRLQDTSEAELLGLWGTEAPQLFALMGDVTKPINSTTTTLANIPSGVTMAGFILATAIAAPATPAAGSGSIYVDSTSKNLAIKNDAGTVNHGVQTMGAVSHAFLTAIADDGTVSSATIASADLTTALTTPPTIGGTTPAAGTFTAVTVSGVTTTTVLGGTAQTTSGSSNGSLEWRVTNSSNGASALAQFRALNDQTLVTQMVASSSGRSGAKFGITLANWGELSVSGASALGLIVGCSGVSVPIVFGSNTSEIARFTGGTLASDSFAVKYTVDATSPTAAAFTSAGGVAAAKGIVGGTTITVQSANGGQWIRGQASELLTLSTSGTTTDTSANLLPANAIIEAVVFRITTTILTATAWEAGDATIATRFLSTGSALILGTTAVGLNCVDQTGTSGPKQSAAAKVRITTTGTPTAGTIRITVFYRQFVAPTS